jgi:hypothetical protein
MNINPLQLFARRKNATPDGQIGAVTRATQPLGPWQGQLGSWVPRQGNPYLYEAMREAVPVLDGGIDQLVSVDGIIEIEGDNGKLVAEIQDWMDGVPVNDTETGLQAFYASQGNEVYEQGFGIGEMIRGPRGRDILGLRVADSKGVVYQRAENGMRVFYHPPSIPLTNRPDGLDQIQAILQGRARQSSTSALTQWGFVELEPLNLVTAVNKPEADNVYGTSVLRSLPFVTQILVKMQNATSRVWERFGDPIFHVSYSTKNGKLDAAELEKRANAIAANLGKALAAKARGQSMDLATAAGSMDTVTIEVLGGEGEALQIEMPAKHMLEQITAAFGMPAWMLGIQGATVQGQSEQQAILVLQQAKTRFERRRPGLERVIATLLRSRGRTWKKGDWKLVQRTPNLMDESRQAQAAFLRAQTAMMLAEGGQAPEVEGIDNNLRAALRDYLTKAAAGEPMPPMPPELVAGLARLGF